MSLTRRTLAAIAGLALGSAGCNAVSSSTAVPQPPGASGPSLFHDLALFIVLIGLVVMAAVAVSILRHARAHQRLATRLARTSRPAALAGGPVGLVSGVRMALVAGLRRPVPYLSPDVVELMTPPELTGVLLHERHHVERRAPVRLVVLDGLWDVLGRIRMVGVWIVEARARIEIDADAHALAAGAARSAMASAILKLSDTRTPSTSAGFASATEIRLRVLLGEDWTRDERWQDDARLILTIATMVVVVCAAASL